MADEKTDQPKYITQDDLQAALKSWEGRLTKSVSKIFEERDQAAAKQREEAEAKAKPETDELAALKKEQAKLRKLYEEEREARTKAETERKRVSEDTTLLKEFEGAKIKPGLREAFLDHLRGRGKVTNAEDGTLLVDQQPPGDFLKKYLATDAGKAWVEAPEVKGGGQLPGDGRYAAPPQGYNPDQALAAGLASIGVGSKSAAG